MTLIREEFGLRPKRVLDIPDGFICGIECEIEDLIHTPDQISKFKIVGDGSLRNGGLEFISEPMSMSKTIEAFVSLHDQLKYGEGAFSSRTSTHVHINCRHMEMEQVKTMLLLYALYEPLFFSIVAPHRQNNIHCVALSDTYLSSIYASNTNYIIGRWHKYTALNLLPLISQGSVEFRHLEGTNSAELLTTWLKCLEQLQTLAMKISIDANNLSDKAQINIWAKEIFKHIPTIMNSDIPELVYNSVLDVKLAFFK
jgi:Putative amidoligase enzyme